MRVPLDAYPGMNRFVRDWLGGDERFLPRGGQAILPVDRADRQDCLSPTKPLTIIAGQQVGFAGGPLYTLAKLATLVRMKRDFERSGQPVKAYFWLATEDHDFDEVASLNVPVQTLGLDKNVNRQVDLVCMRAVRAADAKAAVGSLPVPEVLIEQFLSLFDLPRPGWLRAGITFRESFAELIGSVFGDEITLIDALDPQIRKAGTELFTQIRTRNRDIQDALHERAKALEAAGYQEQVIARDGDAYTLLFELGEDGTRRASMSEVPPERTSTSALTRPLLQDLVLKPDVFVGGPAEVAYYAQIAPLHEMLGIAMPKVALRGHALVLPQRLARALDRYGIGVADIFRSPDELLAEREPEGVARIHALRDEAKRDLMVRIEQIAELALPAQHSLAGSIERSIGHIEYHFDKLAERAVKGLVRKDRERYAAAREAVATLFPDRHVQDRVVSWFAYYARYGPALVEKMIDEIEPDSAFFKVVNI